MLAEQCNKIINRSSPPFNELPSSKSCFHPWRKAEPSSPSPCALTAGMTEQKTSSLTPSPSSSAYLGYGFAVTSSPPISGAIFPADLFNTSSSMGGGTYGSDGSHSPVQHK
ncbi:unnamed protein product, partial [Candidula unifasciata]